MCYCEHKNGQAPNNGIMCGYTGKPFSVHGYCGSDETCVGPTANDPLSKRFPSIRKAELCLNSKGKHDFDRLITFSSLKNI